MRSAMENRGFNLTVSPLKGKENYAVWAHTMEQYLKGLKLDGFVLEGGPKIENRNDDPIGELHHSAINFLLSALSEEMKLKILHCRKASDIWKHFAIEYGKNGANEKLELMNELYSCSVKSPGEVQQLVTKVQQVCGKMKNVGMMVDDAAFIHAILKALPPSFAMFKENWELQDVEQQTLDRLVDKIRDRAKKMVQQEVDQTAMMALRTGQQGPMRPSGYPEVRGPSYRASAMSRPNGILRAQGAANMSRFQTLRQPRPGDFRQTQQQGKSTAGPYSTCNYCKEQGHWKPNCPKLAWKMNELQNQMAMLMSEEADSPIGQEEFDQGTRFDNEGLDEINFMALDEQDLNQDDFWIADSGASSHMTANKDILHDYALCPPIAIRVGNNARLYAEGYGVIKSGPLRLNRVLHVPNITANLFSIASATRSNSRFNFNQDGLDIYFNDKIVLRGKRSGGTYKIYIKAEPAPQMALTATTLEHWHQRLGHMPQELIKKMIKEDAVSGLKIKHTVEQCTECAINKCRRASHQATTSAKANKSGQSIHFDTIGSMNPEGMSGNQKFILVATDEFSAYKMIMTLRAKSEIPEATKRILNMIETQLERPVVRITSDNGTEFTSERLGAFVQNKGIDHNLSAPYVPEQNGMAERANRTILTQARTLLNAAKLPLTLWPEAVATAVYTLNRSISRTRSKTPYELWFGKRPSVNNLHIFGEWASVRIPDPHRKYKLGERGKLMRFVGYTENFQTFRFFCPLTNNFVSSCDVLFTSRLDFPEKRNIEGSESTPSLINVLASQHVLGEAGGDGEYDQLTAREARPVAPDITRVVDTTALVGNRTERSAADKLTDAHRDHQVDLAEMSSVNNATFCISNHSSEPKNSTRRDELTAAAEQGRQNIGRVNGKRDLDAPPVLVDMSLTHDIATSNEMEGADPPPVLLERELPTDTDVPERQYQRVEGPPEPEGEPDSVAVSNDSKLGAEVQRPEESVVKTKRPVRLDISVSPLMTRSRTQQNKRASYKTLSKNCEDLSALVAQEEAPCSYAEAMSQEDALGWQDAMDREIRCIQANDVYEIVPRPNVNVIGCRWVFSDKLMPDKTIRKKARLVAKGFTQKQGVDYVSTFAPVIDMTLLRFLFALAVNKSLKIIQFDVKSAFLNGELKETIYMRQPEGYVDNPDLVWRLKRSLYGLKQSPRAWNDKFTRCLISLGLNQSQLDDCIFFRQQPFTIVAVYVDDALIMSEGLAIGEQIVTCLEKEFEIHRMNNGRFLGFQYEYLSDGSIILHQANYIRDIVEKFGLSDANPAAVPMLPGQGNDCEGEPWDCEDFRAMVGSLQYAACITRPDIAFVTGRLARKVTRPTKQDYQIAKHCLRYLKGNLNLGIRYAKSGGLAPIAYCDADFAGDREKYRSTTGQIVMLQGGPIAWKSKLQRTTVTSTSEAEFISITSTIKSVKIIRNLGIELQVLKAQPVEVRCDNSGAVQITAKQSSPQRTRHLGAHLHYARDHHENGTVAIKHIPADKQIADLFTKPLAHVKFASNRSSIMFKMLTFMSMLLMCGGYVCGFEEINFTNWIPTKYLTHKGSKIELRQGEFPNRCTEYNQTSESDPIKSTILKSLFAKCTAERNSILLPIIEGLKTEIGIDVLQYNQREKRSTGSRSTASQNWQRFPVPYIPELVQPELPSPPTTRVKLPRLKPQKAVREPGSGWMVGVNARTCPSYRCPFREVGTAR